MGTCKLLVKAGVLLRMVHPLYLFLVIRRKHEKVPFFEVDFVYIPTVLLP